MSGVVTLDQVAARVRDLPPLPAIVMDLIASLGSDSMSSDLVAQKLSRDPGLSAKTLRIANSPFFGMARQIASIPDALTILGLRAVRTLILAAGMVDTFKQMERAGFEFKPFWRHAMGAGLCGQLLARELHMDDGIGFTIGLLHDVGRLALASSFPDLYVNALSYQRQMDLLLIDAEDHVLGVNHAQVGALLLERWSFSPVIVEAVANHHHPAMHHGPGLVGLAHMADAFSHALGLSGELDEQVPPTPPEIWTAMAPGAEKCVAMFSEIEGQFAGVCQALQV